MDGDLFDGMESVEARPNLFFAIFPPVELRGLIAGLRNDLVRKHRLSGYQIPEHEFHITVCHFNADPEPLGKILRIAKAVVEVATASTQPFEIGFNQIIQFRGGSIVLTDQGQNAELRKFHEVLMTEFMHSRFIPRKNLDFNPHLTLLRDQMNSSEEPMSPISWTAKELVLVQRYKGEGYQFLGRWQFRG